MEEADFEAYCQGSWGLPCFRWVRSSLPKSIFFLSNLSRPFLKSSDMSIEMTSEIVDLVAMAVDKFIAVKNYEVGGSRILVYVKR